MADKLINKIIGRYKILNDIDKGGMGKVYLAEHIFTHKKVALKTLLMGWLSDLSDLERKEVEERFRREAQAAAQIAHDNVVEIYDFDVAKENIPAYIAMELLVGESLEKVFKKQGRFSFKKALPLMIQISDGIAEAHQKGFIHRDLKPANVMIISTNGRSKQEKVKIVDFGIAKVFDSDLTKITKYGQILGTPTHCPPEQWENTVELEIDERADVYALGLIFYEMLEGAMPFRSNSPQGWVTCHLYDTPKPFSVDIPKQIVEIIMQSLQKDREKRPKSAIELRNRLIEIEEQIEEREKHQEKQLIENLKNQLRISFGIVEDYKKKLELNILENESLRTANIKLTKEKNDLFNLMSKKIELPIRKRPPIKNSANITVELHATSHIGRVCKDNKDNYLLFHISEEKYWTSSQEPDEFIIESQRFTIDDDGIILAVSDGTSNGVASTMAFDTIVNQFLKLKAEQTFSPEDFEESLVGKLYQATLSANHQIHEQRRLDRQFQGMSATFTGAGITPESVDLVQVGDSRGYLIRSSQIYQITQDQTVFQQLIDAVEIQEFEPNTHPLKNERLQRLGEQNEIYPVAYRIVPRHGDILLLCSDGLSNKVSGLDMHKIVMSNPDNLGRACAELVKEANERGGEDNITLIVAKLIGYDSPEPTEDGIKLELLEFSDEDEEIEEFV